MKVLLSGGGTGGHVYPAIAIANKIKEENPDLPIIIYLVIVLGSFASQRYIMEYGNQLDGLILSGSNGKHGEILKVGEFLSNYICKNMEEGIEVRL